MDVKIENYDIVTDNSSAAVMIGGVDEVLQKIRIALTVPRESFAYDRSMGAFSGEKTDEPAAVESLINEALLGSRYLVEVTDAFFGEDGELVVSLRLSDGIDSTDAEVVING